MVVVGHEAVVHVLEEVRVVASSQVNIGHERKTEVVRIALASAGVDGCVGTEKYASVRLDGRSDATKYSLQAKSG